MFTSHGNILSFPHEKKSQQFLSRMRIRNFYGTFQSEKASFDPVIETFTRILRLIGKN